MLRNKTVMRVFSLLFAIGLWMYIMAEVDPITERTLRWIPVQIANREVLEDRDLVLLEDAFEVHAVISGSRSEVIKIDEKKLTARVDVADCHAGKNTMHVETDAPQGISILSVEPANINITVENRITEAREVQPVSSVDGTALELVDGQLEVDPSEVMIHGAESAVAKVESVQVMIPEDQLTDALQTFQLKPLLMDQNGEVVRSVSTETETIKVNAKGE